MHHLDRVRISSVMRHFYSVLVPSTTAQMIFSVESNNPLQQSLIGPPVLGNLLSNHERSGAQYLLPTLGEYHNATGHGLSRYIYRLHKSSRSTWHCRIFVQPVFLVRGNLLFIGTHYKHQDIYKTSEKDLWITWLSCVKCLWKVRSHEKPLYARANWAFTIQYL